MSAAAMSLFEMGAYGGSRKRQERDVEALLRKLDLARSARKNWDNHCSEVALRMWPEADDFITKRSPNIKRREEVFDSTAARALGKFSAAMQSLLIPRQQMWHKLKASDEALNRDASVKAWFEELNLVLFRMRNSPKANYYGQMRIGMKSLGAFGGLCLYVDENPNGGIRYRNCHVGQIWIALDHEGRVDTIFRVYPQSAKAAVQQFGIERLGEKVKAALEKNPFQEFDFCHAVTPRMSRDPLSLGPDAMRWDSVYIGIEDRNVLQEGGFEELPYMYGRWDVSPGETYPRSPAMECLAEQKTLNSQKKALLRSAHIAAAPPIMMSDEGVFGFGSKAPRFVPEAPLYGMLDSQGKPRAMPFVSGSRTELTVEMMEQERTAINDSFLVTLFRILVEDPRSNVTAYEIAQRMQEKGELLAPSVSSQQSEILGPEIERSVNIIIRQGLVSPMPPIMLEASGDYEIEYVSPAAQLQRAAELAGITRTIQLVEPLAENDPTVYDVFDPEEIARIGADINGAPIKALRTPEAIAEIRQARADAAQKAQEAEMAQMGAGAMKDGAAALTMIQGGQGGGGTA